MQRALPSVRKGNVYRLGEEQRAPSVRRAMSLCMSLALKIDMALLMEGRRAFPSESINIALLTLTEGVPPTQLVDCSYSAYEKGWPARVRNPTNAVGGLFILCLRERLAGPGPKSHQLLRGGSSSERVLLRKPVTHTPNNEASTWYCGRFCFIFSLSHPSVES